MTRINTADAEMIRDFAELKAEGITDFILQTSTDKKTYKPVIKHTAQGVSSYANQMFDTYGDSTIVEVYYFDNEFNEHKYCTYAA